MDKKSAIAYANQVTTILQRTQAPRYNDQNAMLHVHNVLVLPEINALIVYTLTQRLLMMNVIDRVVT